MAIIVTGDWHEQFNLNLDKARFYAIIRSNRAQSSVVGLSGNTSGPFHGRKVC